MQAPQPPVSDSEGTQAATSALVSRPAVRRPPLVVLAMGFSILSLCGATGLLLVKLVFGVPLAGPCATRSTCHLAQRRIQVAQREQLLAEQARLQQLIAAYEEQVTDGQGCRMGLVKYRLDLLRVERQLATCGMQRARIDSQIQHLESLRQHMLDGAGRPSAHAEPAND